MMDSFLVLLLSVVLILWLGAKILDKAGIEKKWVFCLLIPLVNMIMIWVFAFSAWNNHRQMTDDL